MQPNMTDGTCTGHVIIDIEKDTNIDELLPIILDINNITITTAQGILLIMTSMYAARSDNNNRNH